MGLTLEFLGLAFTLAIALWKNISVGQPGLNARWIISILVVLATATSAVSAFNRERGAKAARQAEQALKEQIDRIEATLSDIQRGLNSVEQQKPELQSDPTFMQVAARVNTVRTSVELLRVRSGIRPAAPVNDRRNVRFPSR